LATAALLAGALRPVRGAFGAAGVLPPVAGLTARVRVFGASDAGLLLSVVRLLIVP
jgi:hypothetical protein